MSCHTWFHEVLMPPHPEMAGAVLPVSMQATVRFDCQQHQLFLSESQADCQVQIDERLLTGQLSGMFSGLTGFSKSGLCQEESVNAK